MTNTIDRGTIPCGFLGGQLIPNQSTGAAPIHQEALLAPGVAAAPPLPQPTMAFHPLAPPFTGGGFFPGPIAGHPPPPFFSFPPPPVFHTPHQFPIPWHPTISPVPTPGPPAGSLAAEVPGDTLGGGLPGGFAYVWPKDHARVQVTFAGEKVWKDEDPKPEFTGRKVPTSMPLREFMEQIGAKGDEWVCTEVIEKGNGKWQKGTSIEYTDDKSKDPVEKFGWTKDRSKTAPVFVVLHKK